MVKKKASSLEISDIRVKYDKNDGSLRITSKDPDLKGKPFSLTITGDSPTAETLFELMRENGLVVNNAIPTSLTVENKSKLESFYDQAYPLRFQLGETYNSAPVELDLGKAPHVLVSGSTGSGKSVLLRSFVDQVMLRDDFKVTIFDPTTVEWDRGSLRRQDKIVTTSEELAVELTELDDEIQYRYSQMEEEGVTHFKKLNTKLRYRVLVIDYASNFFDGVGVDKNDGVAVAKHELAKQLLFKIPRYGRAAGVHLIIGTQRFDFDMIPGEVLANLGARVTMGAKSYIETVALLGDKPEYGSGVLNHHGRGILRVYDKQTPFQAYYVTPDAKESDRK